MKALVLSGGGSRGAYQAGAWEAIHETGWTPDVIYGTSVGAINGAMIAMWPPEGLEKWWTDLKQRNVTAARPMIWKAQRWRSFLDAEPLRRMFEKHADVQAIRDDRRLHITTTDVERGEERLWYPHEITVELLMATSALLPGLAAVDLEGDHHADGGHWSALPLRHALESGADDVQVLLHDPIEPHWQPAPRSIRASIRRQSDLVWHGRQTAEWKWLQARMRLPKKDPEYLAKSDVRFYAPDPPLDSDILRFGRGEGPKLYARGYEETKAILAVNPIT